MILQPDQKYLREPVFLDAHATTPCAPKVVEAMLPFFTTAFGNPASATHGYGAVAETAVKRARAEVARLIGANPGEITFTSGATEACNLVLKGGPWRRIITVATEHKAVLAAAEAVRLAGSEVVVLDVQRDGFLDLAVLESALKTPTDLVAVMAANNETGVLQPIPQIAALCRLYGASLFSDATQYLPWLPLDVRELDVDYLAFSAHKLYGPKGAGALYCRSTAAKRLLRQMDGGGQERGLRAGTLNVPAIVGFGVAAAETLHFGRGECDRVRALRDTLLARLAADAGPVIVHGSVDQRLPNNLCVSFVGLDAEPLLARLPDIAASMGSACYSGAPEPSYVIRALGVPYSAAWSAVRFGLSRNTGLGEIEYAAGRIAAEVHALRGLLANASPGLAHTAPTLITASPVGLASGQ
jgi:cysteine desulfurase